MSYIAFIYQDSIQHLICTGHFDVLIDMSRQWLYMSDMASQIRQLDCLVNNKENVKCLNYWPFVMGIHRSPMDSPHKRSVMRKAFPCYDGPRIIIVVVVTTFVALGTLFWKSKSSDMCTFHMARNFQNWVNDTILSDSIPIFSRKVQCRRKSVDSTFS